MSPLTRRRFPDAARVELDIELPFEHVRLDHGSSCTWDQRATSVTDPKRAFGRWHGPKTPAVFARHLGFTLAVDSRLMPSLVVVFAGFSCGKASEDDGPFRTPVARPVEHSIPR
jgi:hypothetical protein